MRDISKLVFIGIFSFTLINPNPTQAQSYKYDLLKRLHDLGQEREKSGKTTNNNRPVKHKEISREQVYQSETAEKIVVAEGQGWKYYQDTGLKYLKKGSYYNAIEHLKYAAKLAPNPGYVYGLLATAYSKAGQRQKAQEMRRKMHELSKQNLDLAPILSFTARIDDSSGGNGDGQLEAGERTDLVVAVSNFGEGAAFNVAVILSTSSFYVSKDKQLVEILKVNETKEVRFSINIPEDAADAVINIGITAKDPREYEYAQSVSYALKGLIAPKLAYTSQFREDGSGTSSGNGDRIIQNGETVELIIEVSNNGEGDARDVVVELSALDKHIKLKRDKVDIGRIPPHETVKTKFVFETSQWFNRKLAPLRLIIRERHGFGLSDKLDLEAGTLTPKLIVTQRVDDSVGGNRNNRLEAGESADLVVTITNTGQGDAIEVEVGLDTPSPLVKLKKKGVGYLRKNGGAQEVIFPIEIPENAQDGSIIMDIVAKDPRGYSESIPVSIAVKGIIPPDLRYRYEIGDDGIGYSEGNANGLVENGERIELRLVVENLGAGKAREVVLRAKSSDPRIVMEKDTLKLREIGPKPSEASGKIVFFVPHDYAQDKFTLKLTATEKYGFGFTKKEVIPVKIVSPLLTYSFDIKDVGGRNGYNGIIDPNENITLLFKVKNSGEATARGVKIAFAEPAPKGIKINKKMDMLGNITPGGELSGELKFHVKQTVSTDKLRFPFVIHEEYNRGAKDVIELALGSKQDTEPPTIKVLSPRDKSPLDGNMINVDIEITDNMALADLSNISLKLNQAPIRKGDIDIRRVGNILKIKGSVPAMPGDNSLIILAKDKAGNQASQRVTVFAKREERALVHRIGPEIIITSPENNVKTDREVVKLSVRIRDDKGIKEYKLFVNGNAFRGLGGVKSEQRWSRDSREVILNEYVSLQHGQNTIEIVAIDTDNIKESATLQVNYSSIGEVWAVVIGISKYMDKRISSLEYADADARAFYEFLLSQYGGRIKKENVRCLINEDATYKNIREALRLFLNGATKNDIVIIYFAGHGGPEPGRANELYLIPHDAYYAQIASQAIPMDEVARIINKRIYADRVIMIADACHSGGLLASADDVKTRDTQVTAAITSKFFSELAKNTGKIIITASGSGELSQEGKKYGGGHGAFTHFLLEGLKGKADGRVEQDGIITVREAYEYALEKVARATGNKQHPNIEPGVNELLNKDFPLARVGF